MSESARLKQF